MQIEEAPKVLLAVKAANSRGFKLEKAHESAIRTVLEELGFFGQFSFHVGNGKPRSTSINLLRADRFDAGRRCMRLNVKGDGANVRQIEGWLYVPPDCDANVVFDALQEWQTQPLVRKESKLPTPVIEAETVERVAEVKDMTELTMPDLHLLLQDQELVAMMLHEIQENVEADPNGYRRFGACEAIMTSVALGLTAEQLPAMVQILVHNQKVLEVMGVGDNRHLRFTKKGRTLINHHTSPPVRTERPALPVRKPVQKLTTSKTESTPTPSVPPVSKGGNLLDHVALIEGRVNLAKGIQNEISRKREQIEQYNLDLRELTERGEKLTAERQRAMEEISQREEELKAFASDIEQYNFLCSHFKS